MRTFEVIFVDGGDILQFAEERNRGCCDVREGGSLECLERWLRTREETRLQSIDELRQAKFCVASKFCSKALLICLKHLHRVNNESMDSAGSILTCS